MVKTAYLLGVRFYPADIEEALGKVIGHISDKKGDFFCLANINDVMVSNKYKALKQVINLSTANFADGMGTAWALKLLGYKFKGRVRGTDLMLKLCDYAAKKNLKIFLYGNTENTLMDLREKLKTLYTDINIVGVLSPPYRELTPSEDWDIIDNINKSDADIIFVSLGCPKQQQWMAAHKEKIKPVQLGVGAAFDFIIGKVKPAPIFVQKIGLEWFYRMFQEPKKTIYRMLLVPVFIFKLLKQMISEKHDNNGGAR